MYRHFLLLLILEKHNSIKQWTSAFLNFLSGGFHPRSAGGNIHLDASDSRGKRVKGPGLSRSRQPGGGSRSVRGLRGFPSVSPFPCSDANNAPALSLPTPARSCFPEPSTSHAGAVTSHPRSEPSLPQVCLVQRRQPGDSKRARSPTVRIRVLLPLSPSLAT